MSEQGQKSTALQNMLARSQANSLATLLDTRILPLFGGTLLLILGVFFGWQSWLVISEIRGASHSEEVRNAEIHVLGEKVSEIRIRVNKAVDSKAVTSALSAEAGDTHAAAARALKQVLPELIAVDFYRADLEEVFASDFAKFGYAKAAMLVQAYQMQRGAPLQSLADANKHRDLAYALPVLRDKEIIAYAYVLLPFDLLQETFRQSEISGARVDLRQGDGRGDLLLDSIGDTSSVASLNTPGMAIPNSAFRIDVVQSEYFIVATRNLWLLLPLTLFAIAAGLFLLHARRVGWERARAMWQPVSARSRKAKAVESTLADAIQVPSVAAPKTTAAKPSTAAETADAEVSVDRSIFRAYDIRGVLGTTLNKDVARLIGRAIGSEAQQRGLKEIVVARDGRLSGPELSAALISGLRSTGCDVIDIGAAPTPVLYFATYHLNTSSGVMVTGSHNPPDYNGFKIVLGGETLSEGAIQNLYARISESRFATGSGGLQIMNILHDYAERVTEDVQVEHKLKVVVDCGNGIAGAVAPGVLEGIGCEVLPLFCDVDGKFPNHHPDPSDPHNLQDLILSVKQMKADIGVAFDGDGDRLGVVTANGDIIYPDRVLMLFAKDVLSRNPGAAIIYDVKCTGKLQPLILQAGGSPIMWKTGHSLIKAKMRETDAELAGEMSGHFFFKERWYGFDDGIYAAARLLEIIASDAEGRKPQQIFDALPKGVSTPELKIPMSEGEHYRFIDQFQQKSSFEGARVTTIDGVRADWPDGWGLVRASNTTPVLVLRFDAENDAALRRIQSVFRTQLLALNPKLELPF